jgi:hypothetical protein
MISPKQPHSFIPRKKFPNKKIIENMEVNIKPTNKEILILYLNKIDKPRYISKLDNSGPK